MRRFEVDLVAPPFEGHLHPILGLARVLSEFAAVRILTTADAGERIAALGLETCPILSQRTKDVWRIANTEVPVRGRPLQLWRQFRQNLALMAELQQEIAAIWGQRRPDVAVVDFTLPAVGHWAQASGIRWWTTHPSPLAIESPDGPPTYLGGWRPPVSRWERIRNSAGRKTIPLFKRTLFALNRRPLQALGLQGVYRDDGTESVYSDEVILGLSSAELEFPRTWPKAMRWLGPVFYTPKPKAPPVVFDGSRKNVLVTIGTHLPFVRAAMVERLKGWAAAMPGVFFHYSAGGHATQAGEAGENWRIYRYIDYEDRLENFSAIVHHGGAGITHYALRAGLPVVVWPQDYDQFDYAARLEVQGLAVRLQRPSDLPHALARALEDSDLRRRVRAFGARQRENDLRDNLLGVLVEKGLCDR